MGHSLPLVKPLKSKHYLFVSEVDCISALSYLPQGQLKIQQAYLKLYPRDYTKVYSDFDSLWYVIH